MGTRTDLIQDFADQIACGETVSMSAGDFLEALYDEGRITFHQVAVLLTCSEHADAHMDVSDTLRDLVEAAAVEFFTNEPAGVNFIDDKLAEIEADEADEAAYQRHQQDTIEIVSEHAQLGVGA